MRRTPAPTAVLLTLLTLVASTFVVASAGAATAPSADTARTSVAAARAVGQPPIAYAPPAGNFFSYPNRGKKAKLAIRSRVLNSIKGTWGGPRTSIGTPMNENGKIRITTWTFDDWAIARALVAARNRGVSVQVIAARSTNKQNRPWKFLKKRLGQKLYRAGYPTTRETVSFARDCRGSCRGPGGTAHSKYFLFDKVGRSKQRYVTFHTSMNLTRFGYTGQWNQGTVIKAKAVYDDFLYVFRQSRPGTGVARPYRARRVTPLVIDYFFPRLGAGVRHDPVVQTLNGTRCRGAGYGGTRGRTRIRVIQYAMYGDRGVWIAKRLRSLWNAGCDVKMIYSLTTRPVLKIMRNGSGRGAIPMRQSVTKNGLGEIVKYNHSKWMTITGNWNGRSSAWVTFNGSANWSLAAFGSDEQMQQIRSVGYTRPYLLAFARTWKQKTSKKPPRARFSASGRALPIPGVPENEPAWGQGIYKYMTPEG